MRAETRIIWDASEIAGWQRQIIVEMYPKVKTCGSIRRKYLAAFTYEEREAIRELYEQFRRWANVTGAPSEHEAKPNEVALIQRAVAFFGTV